MTAHSGVDYTAPLPLGHTQALKKAYELRNLGGPWSWTVIAAVIEQYHGFKRNPKWYQQHLIGRVEAKPRGMAYGYARPGGTPR